MLRVTKGFAQLSDNVSLVQLGGNRCWHLSFGAFEKVLEEHRLADLCCVRGVVLSFTSIFRWL